jgi:hypothetical protein
MGVEDDPIFGGSDKLYYSEKAKEYVEALEAEHIVNSKIDAYQIGLAIGLRAGATEPDCRDVNFGNLYSLRDEWVVKAIMYHTYPDKTPKERADLMHEHAEAGIRMLYDHWRVNGAVDWQFFIHPASGALRYTPQKAGAQSPIAPDEPATG